MFFVTSLVKGRDDRSGDCSSLENHSSRASNKSDYAIPLDEIDEMLQVPVEGQRLVLASSTHKSEGIVTSEVQFIEKQLNGYIVVTKNSHYHIEIIGN